MTTNPQIYPQMHAPSAPPPEEQNFGVQPQQTYPPVYSHPPNFTENGDPFVAAQGQVPPIMYAQPPQGEFQGMMPLAQPLPPIFSSGVCDCFQDCEGCVLGWCCWPYIAADTNARLHGREGMDTNDWFLFGAVLLSNYIIGFPVCNIALTFSNRRLMRQTFQFPDGEGIADIFLSLFCGPCVECQQVRELKYRSGRLPLQYAPASQNIE